MEVRLLDKRDEAGYLALRAKSIEEHAGSATQEVLRELDGTWQGNGDLLATYDHERKSVFGAFYGGSLVGIVALDAGPAARNPQDIRLWGLYVIPRLRGTPISQLLLEQAIAWSRERQKITVSVRFPRSNKHAFRFFDRNYFSVKPANMEPEAQASTVDAVFMDYFLGE